MKRIGPVIIHLLPLFVLLGFAAAFLGLCGWQSERIDRWMEQIEDRMHP